MVRIKDFYKTVLGITDPDILQRFTENSRVETVARGNRVISMGEKMEVLYFLLEGVLRGYVVDENGQDITDCFVCNTAAFAPPRWYISKPSAPASCWPCR